MMTFDNGATIKIPPHDLYESWHITDSKGFYGLKMICMPGGDLAIWKDEAQ